MRQFIDIIEDAQSSWFEVTIESESVSFGMTVEARTEEQAEAIALQKFAAKWGDDKIAEVTKVEPTGEPPKPKSLKAREYKPRPKKIKPIIVNKTRLKDGRAILPTPANGEKWMPDGEPFLIDIDQLDLNPDGLGTAYSAFFWNDKAGTETQTSDRPVSVTMVDGQYHVLDGYHRVVKAHRHGKTQILVKPFV